MSEFKCSGCDYKSELRKSIERHINKASKCSDNPKIVSIEIDVSCNFCNKTFCTKPSLTRHLKTCKVKKKDIQQELEKEKEKNAKLKEENNILKALSKKPSTVNYNNQININLTPWNSPVLPDNVEKYYSDALKKLFLSVPTIIKQIHFNSELPQNHNICIKNARSGIAKVYNGKEWESMDEKDVISSLINDYESTLEDYASEKNPKYIEKMKKIKERDSEEKVYEDLQDEIKRIIYDRNHMVKIKN